MARFAMVTVEAPAKLNLHLQVLGRRDSGFHDILSLFQAISLADSLELRSLKGYRGVELLGSFDCPPHENTIVRAAKAWLSAAGIDAGVEIGVSKRIPAGAGLGGGSSDAAATLRGLEALFGISLPKARLQSIAVSIGSDVPFFLGTPRALVSGRGEVLEALEPGISLALVVVYPGFPVSTPFAYGALDSKRSEPEAFIREDPDATTLKALLELAPSRWAFRNDFLDALLPSFPELGVTIERLGQAGASFAGLSGSGSACFGVFENEADADRAASFLRAEGRRAFPCSMLARYTQAVYTSPEDSSVGQGERYGNYRHPHPQDQRRGEAKGLRDGDF